MMVTPGAVAAGGALAIPAALSAADQVTSGGLDIWNLIGTIITPAAVIVLVLLGKLRTEAEVRGYEAQIKALNNQLDLERNRTATLQSGLIEQAVPALTRQTLILERVTPLLERVSLELEQAARRRGAD